MKLGDELNARIAAISAKAIADKAAIDATAAADIAKLQGYLAAGGVFLQMETDAFAGAVTTMMSMLRAK